MGRFGHAAEPHEEGVEHFLAGIGHRDELGAARLDHALDVEDGGFLDPGLHGGDAGDFRDLLAQSLRGAAHLGEHMGEAVALVICSLRFLERLMRADAEHQGRHAGRHDQRDGQDLRLEPPQVAHKLAVEGAHRVTS
jgi:hypothetical protein